MSAWKDREGLLALLVGVLLIIVIVAGVLAFAPLVPFEVDDSRTVGSAGSPKNLVLNVEADVCKVEIAFSAMEGRSVLVELDLDGRRGMLVSDPDVEFTVEHAQEDEDLLVDIVLNVGTGPTVQYDDPRMLVTVDIGLKATLNVMTEVGDIVLEAPSSARLDGVSIFAKVGAVHADLVGGTEVLGDMELKSRVGSVHASFSNLALGDGVRLNLTTSTGSVYLDMVQTVVSANSTILLKAGTGSAYLDLDIAGDVSSELTSQTNVGGIDTDLSGFSGMDVHLVSDNHPADMVLTVFLQVDVGSINIDATWSG